MDTKAPRCWCTQDAASLPNIAALLHWPHINFVTDQASTSVTAAAAAVAAAFAAAVSQLYNAAEADLKHIVDTFKLL